MLLTIPAAKELLAMSVFKLADEHPLTKVGLRCVHIVEEAELGLKSGDVVFEFPFVASSTPVWRVDATE